MSKTPTIRERNGDVIWLRRAIKEAKGRYALFQHTYKEATEMVSSATTDKAKKQARRAAVRQVAQLIPLIQKAGQFVTDLQKALAGLLNPKNADVGKDAVKAFMDTLIAAATDAEREAVLAACGRAQPPED